VTASRLQARLGLTLVLLLAVLAFLAQFAAAPDGGVPSSARSRERRGRRAALALLQELGFDARAWNRPPGAIPDEARVVFVPRPDALDAGEEGARAALGELHDLHHYRSFVERGGTLVVPAEGADGFLAPGLGLQAPERAPRADRTPMLRGRSRAGEELELAGYGDPLLSAAEGRAWLAGDAGSALVLEVELGSGRVLVLSGGRWFDNDAIADGDAGLLFVRIAESFARDGSGDPGDPGGAVLFDEYSLGLWQPRSPLAVAFEPRFSALSAHALLVLAILVWRSAFAREFPRDPRALELVSPLARARSATALLERAGRHALVARRLCDGVLARLEASLGLAAPDADPSADALQQRAEAIARRADPGGPLESSVPVLEPDGVAGARDLERLHRGLCTFERAVERALHRPAGASRFAS